MTYNSLEAAMSDARFLAKNNRASSVSVTQTEEGTYEIIYKDLSRDYPWIGK